jgi:AraC-like DNA-binding protein
MNDPEEPAPAVESFRFVFPADAPDSLGAYRAIVAQLFELEPLAPEEPFFGEAEVHCLPDVTLSSANNSPSRFRRTAEMVLQSEADGVLVLAYQQAPVTFETGQGSHIVEPGEIVFFDLRQPVSIVAAMPANISLVVARRRLEALVPYLDQIHGFVLRDGANLQLLASHLQTLRAVVGSISAAQSRNISDATLHLVAGCLLEAPRDAARTGTQAVSLGQVREFIERHLEHHGLGPQTLMQEFGISRASLYRLFAPVGGIAAYIQERRLRHAWHVITDPKIDSVRIKQLAYNLGYSHPSAFSRAFRNAFGVTPSAARRRGTAAAGSDEKPWRLAPEAERFIAPKRPS